MTRNCPVRSPETDYLKRGIFYYLQKYISSEIAASLLYIAVYPAADWPICHGNRQTCQKQVQVAMQLLEQGIARDRTILHSGLSVTSRSNTSVILYCRPQ